jgi:hypothetical protein
MGRVEFMRVTSHQIMRPNLYKKKVYHLVVNK